MSVAFKKWLVGSSVRLGLWFLLLYVCIIPNINCFTTPNPPPALDFRTFYVACCAAGSHSNLYDVEVLNALGARRSVRGYVFPYLYPPFFAHAFSFLSGMSSTSAQRFWTLLTILLSSFVVSMTTFWVVEGIPPGLVPEKGIRLFLTVLLVAVVLFFAFPFAHNTDLGQVNILVLSCIMLTLHFDSRNRPVLAGVPLAVAVLIKVSPAMLLIFFAARRRYRLVVATLGSTLLLILMTLPFGAVREWMDFFSFLPNIAYEAQTPGLIPPGDFSNFSIAGFFYRLTGGNVTLGKTLTTLIVLGILVFLFYGTRRAKTNKMVQFWLAGFLILMVISAPFTYRHHVIYIYPALVFVLTFLWMKHRSIPARIGTVSLLLLTVLAGANFLNLYRSWVHGSLTKKLLTSMNLYYLIAIMLSLIVYAILQQREKPVQ